MACNMTKEVAKEAVDNPMDFLDKTLQYAKETMANKDISNTNIKEIIKNATCITFN